MYRGADRERERSLKTVESGEIRVQGKQGENGNSTIWGDVSVYGESWGSLKTGALRGWICVGLQQERRGEPRDSDEAGRVQGRQASTGMELKWSLYGIGSPVELPS